MVGARSACRRPSRSACRARASRTNQPRTMGLFSPVFTHPRKSRRRDGSHDHRRHHRSRDRGPEMTAAPLIEIEKLRVVFHGDDGRTTHAVDSVDLSVATGATLGLVGESGCGKSVTSLAIMGLLSKDSAEVTGSVRFDGFDLLDVPDETLRDLRGNRLAMIFQEPMTSLNPSFTIGEQIIETILRHRGGGRGGGGRGAPPPPAPRPPFSPPAPR